MAGSDSDDEVVDLVPGLQIRIVGLATRPELNGQRGTLKAYDEDRRRWKVEMDGGGLKLFKLANVEPVRGASSEAPAPASASDAQPAPASASDAQPAPASASDAQPAPDPDAVAPPKLRAGSQVAVKGLPGSGRTSLNGRVGVCEYFEFNSGRWHVRFEDGASEAFRPGFLELRTSVMRPGAFVRLEGLRGAAHLNGKVGVCERLDEGGRWSVRLESGERKALKPENLALLERYQAPEDDAPWPGQEQSKHKVAATKDFAAQMEELLESGEMQWMDC